MRETICLVYLSLTQERRLRDKDDSTRNLTQQLKVYKSERRACKKSFDTTIQFSQPQECSSTTEGAAHIKYHRCWFHANTGTISQVTPPNNCMDLQNTMIPSTGLVTLSSGTSTNTKNNIKPLNSHLKVTNVNGVMNGTISIM